MADSKVKDENYFHVSGWMVNKLGLKGIALETYAIIYGFSQDGETHFTGSLQYLCDFTGTSKPTIINALKGLCEKGYLQKYEINRNGVTFCEYAAILQGVKKFNGGSKETLLGGSKETLPNNIVPNNIDDTKVLKERKKSSFDALIADYAKGIEESNREQVVMLLGEWLKVRKAKRAAMTDYAIQLNLRKLDALAKQSGMDVPQYLEAVIAKGWAAFYAVNNYNIQQQGAANGNNNRLDGKPFEANGVHVF